MRLILMYCLGLIVFCQLIYAEDERVKPNIVLILSDDQAWTDYGFMGHPYIQTPHLDRLASRSALFERGYVPTALCRPSLMTLVTGLYSHQHNISGNDPSIQLANPNTQTVQYNELRSQLIANIDKHPTIPKLLGAQGYLSFQSGKWWEGSFRRGGFTHGMTKGFPEKGGRHGDVGLKIGREGMAPVFDFIDYSVDQGKPFYLWYAPFLPHTPHNPPKKLFDRYQEKVESPYIARYYAMCEWFDQTCGQLIDYLEKKRLSDNTLIVYVGDNGWIQQEDGRKFALRSKQSCYEGGVRQPTMFCWPGKIPEGSRKKQLCSSVDIVPTMLAAANAEIPNTLPGINLLPSLTSGEASPRKRVFGEGFAHDIANLIKPDDSLLYRWVIEDQWKLILTYDGKVGRNKSIHPRIETRPQLFNIIDDPFEKENLAEKHPDLIAKLAKAIADWWPSERNVATQWQ